MTTNVIINAHCGSTQEVQVTITEPNTDTEQFYLQDGESIERVVYNGRAITVEEREK